MQIKGTKGYFRDKIKKNDKLKSSYDFITNFYNYLYSGNNSKYKIENGCLYEYSSSYKYKNKSYIINTKGYNFYKKIKNDFINNNKNVFKLKESFLDNYDLIYELIQNNIKEFYNNGEIECGLDGEVLNLKISTIFNDINDFKQYIIKGLEEDKNNTLNFMLFGNLNKNFLLRYNGQIKIISNVVDQYYFGTKNYLDFKIDKKKLLINIEKYVLYNVLIENSYKRKKLGRDEMKFLKNNGIIDNLIDGEFYSYSEILKNINKKNSNWVLIDKYYETAPKYWRKFENKKVKLQNKKNLINGLKSGEFDNINTDVYRRNAAYNFY